MHITFFSHIIFIIICKLFYMRSSFTLARTTSIFIIRTYTVSKRLELSSLFFIYCILSFLYFINALCRACKLALFKKRTLLSSHTHNVLWFIMPSCTTTQLSSPHVFIWGCKVRCTVVKKDERNTNKQTKTYFLYKGIYIIHISTTESSNIISSNPTTTTTTCRARIRRQLFDLLKSHSQISIFILIRSTNIHNNLKCITHIFTSILMYITARAHKHKQHIM